MAPRPARNFWAKVEEKHFVHDEVKANFDFSVSVKAVPLHLQSLDSLREMERRINTIDLQQARDLTGFKGTVEDITIPAPHLPGGIPATVFKPLVLPRVPIIVTYFRGGGLVCGFKEMYHATMMSLVNRTGAIFVIAEYRNLPCAEDRFAPFTDAEAAVQWVLSNKIAVGGEAQSPVGVAGDSAGGQICCSLTYSLPGRLAFQVLVVPVADVDLVNSDSIREFWKIPAFSGRDMDIMFRWSRLFEEPSQADNPRVNPSARRSASDPPLSSVPPTLVIVAELDPLRDWGRAYAIKLRNAGVPVQLFTVESVTHSFFRPVNIFRTTSAQAQQRIADFLKPFAPADSKL